MRFSAIVVTSLFTGFALAAPNTAPKEARDISTTPMAGASLTGNDYSGIVAHFVVPIAPTSGLGNVWISIDGDDCNAQFKTGIQWTKYDDVVMYNGWYQWGTNKIACPDFLVDAGNTIVAELQTITQTEAYFSLVNLSKPGQIAGQKVDVTPDLKLCMSSVHWYIGDWTSVNPGLYPFSAIGKVTFTEVSATKSGQTVGLRGATLSNIEQGNKVLTDVSVFGDNTIIIKST